MVEKACKTCKRLVEGETCPVCKTSSLASGWKGIIIITDPASSEIAKKLGIAFPGKYALKLSK